MPNWCINSLTIRGTNEELQKFKKRYKTRKIHTDSTLSDDVNWLDFSKIISPNKDEFIEEWNFNEEHRKRYSDFSEAWYNEIGYDWKIDNWGTKWNACNTSKPEQSDGELIYHFETAWSPPLPVIQAMMEHHKKLDFYFTYEETGMGFAGELQSEKGQIIEENEYNIESNMCPKCDGEVYNSKRDTEEHFYCDGCGESYTKEEAEKKELEL